MVDKLHPSYPVPARELNGQTTSRDPENGTLDT